MMNGQNGNGPLDLGGGGNGPNQGRFFSINKRMKSN